MIRLPLDVNDLGLERSGLLVRAIAAGADATVVVDGLDEPVTGQLVHSDTTWLTLDDRTSNQARTIPLTRVISITVDYDITDRVAEQQAAVAQDDALLDAVERHIKAIGPTTRPEDVVRTVLTRLQRSGEGAGRGLPDISHAWTLLIEQGRLSPVEQQGS